MSMPKFKPYDYNQSAMVGVLRQIAGIRECSCSRPVANFPF
jgi:hypothetical protein